ncbi:MAG: hypothetical protein M1821_000098 [Bathelium mastoideum]|nr:MAG: hypothetical protein M1821_000098 [Bathelium mastoideum]KAI9687871.1 MAG: hypothetical protein M1822_001952 [Bathelium mastoideum]
MSSKNPFREVPVEVLDLTFSYLDPKSFLLLCSACRALYHADIRLNATYWRRLVQSFRFPNRPAAQGDGEYWQNLYRRLRTQTHAYTWGSNENGSLGHSFPSSRRDSDSPDNVYVAQPSHPDGRKSVSVPKEMEDSSKLGTLVDLQCSAFATVALTSQGRICAVGSFIRPQGMHPELRDLEFPPSYPNPRERHDPATAIQQISAGRTHVLGLSDTGKIWSWSHRCLPGQQIKFLHVGILEGECSQKYGIGRVKKVVAGWNKSSALIEGVGILVWDAHRSLSQVDGPQEQETDTLLVLDAAIVPGTSYERHHKMSSETSNYRVDNPRTSEDIGEIMDYIMMKDYLIFLTQTGRVFASKGYWHTGGPNKSSRPVEIRVPDNTRVTAINGYLRSFGLILANDDVLLATPDLDYLNKLFEAYNGLKLPDGPNQPSARRLRRYPCLQKRGVVSLTFGDEHWHALLRNGSILSGGIERETCGSLGLGGHGDYESRIRGIGFRAASEMDRPIRSNGRLLKQSYAGLGRQVWFEEEKHQWVRFMANGGSDPSEAAERLQFCAADPDAQGELSEWLEHEGRTWEKRDEVKHCDGDGLGPYFALSVAAGARHSGALVLRNDVLVQKIRESCVLPNQADRMPALTQQGLPYVWIGDAFPRLKLSSGREMPGQIPFTQWSEGTPRWDLDFEV